MQSHSKREVVEQTVLRIRLNYAHLENLISRLFENL